jgi:outer membrane receptor protein involved in Fe transport
MRRFPALLLIGSLSLPAAHLAAQEHRQERREQPARPDTTGTKVDSIPFRFFLPPSLGSVDPLADSLTVIRNAAMMWEDPGSVTSLVNTLPGVILRDQVQIGQYTSPTIDGMGWRHTSVLWNGRSAPDPASGIYNLQLMSPEYLEKIEVVTGPRAFLYGFDGSGGVVNLVPQTYATNRPFTRLFYSESSYGYAQSDGTFAQNISTRTNVSAGFHYQGTDGRFANESDQAWGVRGKVRYAVAPSLVLILSEYFTSTYTNLNGGIDPLNSSLPFNPQVAAVMNTDSYEKITRHDLDLMVAGAFFPDSTDATVLTAYYSNNLREYRDEENRLSPNGVFVHQDQRSSWTGVQLTQTYHSPFGEFLGGATGEIRRVEGSPTIGRRDIHRAAFWAKDELTAGGLADIAGYARCERILGSSSIGAGADVRISPGAGMIFFAGASVSSRMPTLTELFWTDSTALGDPGLPAERHVVANVGLEIHPDSGSYGRIALNRRSITHPVMTVPLNMASPFPALRFVSGDRAASLDATVAFSLRVWKLLFEGTGTYFLSRTGGSTPDDLPRVWLSGGAYYRSQLFDSHLDLKAGLRGWYRSRFAGMVFNPQVLAFVPNTGQPLGQASTIDFVLYAHIGDAQIHFLWENLPGISYYASPYYPGLDRVLRFGINWDFWN